MKTNRIIAGALLSGAVAAVGVGLGAGTAHAGAFHWCPGDPPPSRGALHANPDWDMTVCHDYMFQGNQVLEGNPCSLPQFQWFQCPPGTTPVPQMPLIPNK
jgi:hypothetical protein